MEKTHRSSKAISSYVHPRFWGVPIELRQAQVCLSRHLAAPDPNPWMDSEEWATLGGGFLRAVCATDERAKHKKKVFFQNPRKVKNGVKPQFSTLYPCPDSRAGLDGHPSSDRSRLAGTKDGRPSARLKPLENRWARDIGSKVAGTARAWSAAAPHPADQGAGRLADRDHGRPDRKAGSTGRQRRETAKNWESVRCGHRKRVGAQRYTPEASHPAFDVGKTERWAA